MNKARILVIGGGQSARWLLFAVAEQLARGAGTLRGAAITIVERGEEFGAGLAWSREYALDEHLASLAKPISRPAYGDDQQQQLHRTIEHLARHQISVELIGGAEATEVTQDGGAWRVALSSGQTLAAEFVVVATGHWDPPVASESHRLRPWPARKLQQACFSGPLEAPTRVLVLGTYLNAIDAAITLALEAGSFQRDRDGVLRYERRRDFSLMLASRRGQLPKVWGREPPSYLPRHFTDERLRGARTDDGAGSWLSLDAALGLLRRELVEAGGDRVSHAWRRSDDLRRSLGALSQRLSQMNAARVLAEDLTGVSSTGRPPVSYGETQACWWQSVFTAILPDWSEQSAFFPAEDQFWFDTQLRTLFYNHVLPMTLHSALQIDALFRAGVLQVVACGPAYTLHERPEGGGVLNWRSPRFGPQGLQFTHLVDARGQGSDLSHHPSALIRRMFERGLAQPVVRPTRKPPGLGAPLDSNRPIRLAAVSGAGLLVNPESRELVPCAVRGGCFSSGEPQGLYATGPNLLGQFVDAQSLGQVQRDARRIVLDVSRKLRVAQSGFSLIASEQP